jgi:hypothetical protein
MQCSPQDSTWDLCLQAVVCMVVAARGRELAQDGEQVLVSRQCICSSSSSSSHVHTLIAIAFRPGPCVCPGLRVIPVLGSGGSSSSAPPGGGGGGAAGEALLPSTTVASAIGAIVVHAAALCH